MDQEIARPKARHGVQPGSAGAQRISAAHKGSHEHDQRGGFAADPERARTAGAKGGTAVRERYGSDFYRKVGALGGEATRRKLGTEHFASIGRVGGSRKKTSAL